MVLKLHARQLRAIIQIELPVILPPLLHCFRNIHWVVPCIFGKQFLRIHSPCVIYIVELSQHNHAEWTTSRRRGRSAPHRLDTVKSTHGDRFFKLLMPRGRRDWSKANEANAWENLSDATHAVMILESSEYLKNHILNTMDFLDALYFALERYKDAKEQSIRYVKGWIILWSCYFTDNSQ